MLVGFYIVLFKECLVIMDLSSVGIFVDDFDGYWFLVDYVVCIISCGFYVYLVLWVFLVLGFENVSYGCISLSCEDVEWYYNVVDMVIWLLCRNSS